MTPWLDDGDVRVYVGDVRAVLAELPDESVDCVITSPPYWGLRDYGHDGQIGLEGTIDEYVQTMVDVFAQVRRVMAPPATLWLNLGDSYSAYNGGAGPSSALSQTQSAARPRLASGFGLQQKELKPKDLMGVPWRVAFALQADGWWLRSEIIWAKPNPMPESVTDRPTKSHEQVFLLSKQPKYWFDQEAVREPHQYDGRKKIVHDHAANGSHENYANMGTAQERWPNGGRNVRSVWEIATQPFAEAHFATFPEELVRRCLLAGCPAEVCRVCGKPRERIVEVGGIDGQPLASRDPGRVRVPGNTPLKVGSLYDRENPRPRIDRGWSDCGHHAYRPGVVLDPFLGSGTTALVARHHGRHAIGVELNQAYAEIAAKRLQQLSLLA